LFFFKNSKNKSSQQTLKKTFMKIILIFLSSFFLLISGLKAQDFTNKIWQFYSIGEELLSENDVTTYFKMFSDGKMQVLDKGIASMCTWELSEDKKALIVKSNSSSDRWEIKEQTKELLVIENLGVGTLTLKLADDQTIDLTLGIALPEEEPIVNESEPESPKYSIETDYKPSKKDAKLLIGTWDAKLFFGQKLPEGLSIKMELTKKGEITVYINGKADETNTYKLSADSKKMEINRNGKIEYWGIKLLNKNELYVMDKNMGEIQLLRIEQKSKK